MELGKGNGMWVYVPHPLVDNLRRITGVNITLHSLAIEAIEMFVEDKLRALREQESFPGMGYGHGV